MTNLFAPPITFEPNFIEVNQRAFSSIFSSTYNPIFAKLNVNRMRADLNFDRYGYVPREELYFHLDGLSYTYGLGDYARTYESTMTARGQLRAMINGISSIVNEGKPPFNALFANHYIDGRDHLGWHADDSPALDDSSPIAVLSAGEDREIWIKPNQKKLEQILSENPDHVFTPGEEITKLNLNHGSMLIMKPGMQDEWLHRIPKSSKYNAGPRISLTFRRTNSVT